MLFKIEIQSDSVVEMATLFNTMAVLQQNQAAATAEVKVTDKPLPTVTAAVTSEAPSTDEKEEKPKKSTSRRAGADVPPPATPAATAAVSAETTTEISRDEALGYLKTVAEAKNIGGKDLIAFLQAQFGVPKFSDIPASRYVELKNMADDATGEAKPDPLA